MKAEVRRMSWGRLRVWRGGRGPALLAIHGLGGSGRYWEGLEDLVGERFSVVAPDLGGFGGSDKPRRVYDRAFHLETLDTVAEGLGPVVIVGHSLGGVLGVLWAAGRPEQARGLALVSSPFPRPRPRWDPATWAGPRSIVPAAVGGAARIAWPVLSLPAQAFSRYPGAVVRDYGRQTMKSRAWTLWSLWSDPALGPELERSAGAIRAGTPVLVLHAADDRSVRIEDLDDWARVLPQAQQEVVPHGGHQFLLHQRFAPLGPWLSRIASS